MGFFSGLFSNTPSSNIIIETEADAFLHIIYACVASDGDVSEAELSDIVATLNEKKMFSGRNIRKMYEQALKNYRKTGSGSALVQAAAVKISSEMRETVFCLSTDIILADGIVTKDEEAILEVIKNNLEISDTVAQKIVDVMLIKNKGNKS